MLEVENPENLSLAQIAYGRNTAVTAKNLLYQSSMKPLQYEKQGVLAESMQEFRSFSKKLKASIPKFRHQQSRDYSNFEPHDDEEERKSLNADDFLMDLDQE